MVEAGGIMRKSLESLRPEVEFGQAGRVIKREFLEVDVARRYGLRRCFLQSAHAEWLGSTIRPDGCGEEQASNGVMRGEDLITLLFRL